MWIWIRNIIITLFGLKLNKETPILPESTSKNSVRPHFQPIEVKVKKIKPKLKKTSSVIDINSFKDKISEANEQIKFTQADLTECVNEILSKKIPKDYKEAFKHGTKDILYTRYDFKGNLALLLAAFPIIANELAKLGIYDVSNKTGEAIWIGVNDIAKASQKWVKIKPNKPLVTVSDDLIVKFNPKTGTYTDSIGNEVAIKFDSATDEYLTSTIKKE